MNKEYKTNMFGSNGKLCVNPHWVVTYNNNSYEYGGFGNIGIKSTFKESFKRLL